MCFCRRKTNSKEDGIESSGRGGGSGKQYRDQPMAAPQQVGTPKQQAPPQLRGGAPPTPNKEKQQMDNKKGKKSTPRDNRMSKKRAKRPREDDTISNIPEEMPDMEIIREHTEPFYTDEQLM